MCGLDTCLIGVKFPSIYIVIKKTLILN